MPGCDDDWMDTPRTIRLAGALVALEGLVGVGFGGYVAVRGAVADGAASLSLRAVLGESATFIVMGGIVVAIGVALLRGRSWSRTPGIVIQAVLLPAAYSMLGPSRQVLIGAIAGVLVVTTLMLLISEPSRRWSMAHDAARRED
jgi:hypothetical protein